MDEKNARLPEGKTSALDSANVSTGNADLVRMRGKTPVTDSLAISREFERRHGNVLRTLDSLIADGTISRLNFESAEYLDEQRKRRRMIELDERAALVVMPFIGGRNSRAGQVRLVDAFLRLRAAAASHPAIEPTDERSTVRDRRSLYHSAIDASLSHHIALPHIYRAIGLYAGVGAFREMTKADVVVADGFAMRYAAGGATDDDFARIERHRTQLGKPTVQLSLLAGPK